MWKSFKSSNNIKIAYDINSIDPDKKTLIVVHGMAFGSKHLKSHIEDCLSKNCNLVFYDQRFCGNSAEKTDILDEKSVSIETFVQDLENLRIELKLDKLNLLGHGWGARLCVQYCLNHPNRVNSTILVSPQSLHFSVYNARLVNLALKYKKQNLDPQKLLDKYKVFSKNSNVETARDFYSDFFKLFFYDLTENGQSSQIDFTFDDLTSKRVFQLQNFLYNSLEKVDYSKNPSMRAKGENKSLEGFPSVPILLIHGINDLDPWQYTFGTYEQTENPTNLKSDPNGNMYEQAKSDGIEFGKVGVSYLEKLKSINYPKDKVVTLKLDQCGYWPFIEKKSEFSSSVIDFLKSLN